MTQRIVSLNEYAAQISGNPIPQVAGEPIQDTLIHFILGVRAQLHLFHWQTDIDNVHVALGEAYENWDEEMDECAEQTIGQFGRPTLHQPLDVKNLNEVGDLMAWCIDITAKLEAFKSVLDVAPSVQQEIVDLIEVLATLQFKLTLK